MLHVIAEEALVGLAAFHAGSFAAIVVMHFTDGFIGGFVVIRKRQKGRYRTVAIFWKMQVVPVAFFVSATIIGSDTTSEQQRCCD